MMISRRMLQWKQSLTLVHWQPKGRRWMDERCFRPLLCTVKAELGRGQPKGRRGMAAQPQA